MNTTKINISDFIALGTFFVGLFQWAQKLNKAIGNVSGLTDR